MARTWGLTSRIREFCNDSMTPPRLCDKKTSSFLGYFFLWPKLCPLKTYTAGASERVNGDNVCAGDIKLVSKLSLRGHLCRVDPARHSEETPSRVGSKGRASTNMLVSSFQSSEKINGWLV